MRKHLFVRAACIRLLGLWMIGLKKKVYLRLKGSKKDRLLSITSAHISDLRLLLHLTMMNYQKMLLKQTVYTKIENKISTQTKRYSILKQILA